MSSFAAVHLVMCWLQRDRLINYLKVMKLLSNEET